MPYVLKLPAAAAHLQHIVLEAEQLSSSTSGSQSSVWWQQRLTAPQLLAAQPVDIDLSKHGTVSWLPHAEPAPTSDAAPTSSTGMLCKRRAQTEFESLSR